MSEAGKEGGKSAEGGLEEEEYAIAEPSPSPETPKKTASAAGAAASAPSKPAVLAVEKMESDIAMTEGTSTHTNSSSSMSKHMASSTLDFVIKPFFLSVYRSHLFNLLIALP